MINVRNGLAACGVIAALAVTGCSASTGTTTAAGSAPAGSAPAAAPSPTYTPPAWAASLGSGVTVTNSATATAGDGSPGGAMLTEIKAMQSGHFTAMCPVYEPSKQALCKSRFASVSAAQLKSVIPTYKNFTLTYTAIDGDQALLGETGSICQQATGCLTNTDPAAVFDSGKSFTVLWQKVMATQNSGTSSPAYTLVPFVKVGSSWYLKTSSK